MLVIHIIAQLVRVRHTLRLHTRVVQMENHVGMQQDALLHTVQANLAHHIFTRVQHRQRQQVVRQKGTAIGQQVA